LVGTMPRPYYPGFWTSEVQSPAECGTLATEVISHPRLRYGLAIWHFGNLAIRWIGWRHVVGGRLVGDVNQIPGGFAPLPKPRWWSRHVATGQPILEFWNPGTRTGQPLVRFLPLVSHAHARHQTRRWHHDPHQRRWPHHTGRTMKNVG
jgi:hypothetical protein